MVPCPGCSRPNGGNQHRCVYCGAALVDDAAVARETAAALLPPRARGRRGLAVAILPGQEVTADVDALASIFGCDTFMASQMLRRRDPVLVPCPSPVDADAVEEKLASARIDCVVLDYGELDETPEAALIQRARIEPTTVGLTGFDGGTFDLTFAHIECVIVGRVEVEASTETRETRFRLDSENDMYRVDTKTEKPSYDAFTVFDLYGPGFRSRLLESVCTIEGIGYPKARRGAGFARFARWLRERDQDVHVDETYLQLGKQDRRSELTKSGRLVAYGLCYTKEVVGSEEQYSGQDFDDYSVTAWTVWRLAKRKTGISTKPSPPR